MRRKDKEITDKVKIEEILKRNTICRISLCDENKPYVIPMSYGYHDNCLYFHSAKEGRKIDIIKKNSLACFEITENIELLTSDIACKFGTKYTSIIGTGNIELIINDREKMTTAFNIIMKQHSGKDDWDFDKINFNNILILKLFIIEIKGKKSGI